MPEPIDVFISYKREERPLTNAALRALRRAGYTAITDLNIGRNTDFGKAIDRMIRIARLTVVLWTGASAKSDWVTQEAKLAYDLEKAGKGNHYLGVLVEDVALDIQVDLRGKQMLDLSAEGLTEANIARLVAEVQEILHPPEAVSEETAREASEDATADLALFETARQLDTASAYQLYLSNFPKGHFARDAARELRTFSRWYLSPFRRGNVSKTIAAAGVVVGVAGAAAALRDPVVVGVSEDVHAQATQDLAAARGLVAELRSDTEATARATDTLEARVRSLADDLAEATSARDAALEAVEQFRSDALRVPDLEDRIRTLEGDLAAFEREAADRLAEDAPPPAASEDDPEPESDDTSPSTAFEFAPPLRFLPELRSLPRLSRPARSYTSFEQLPFDLFLAAGEPVERHGKWSVHANESRTLCWIASAPIREEFTREGRSVSAQRGEPLFVAAVAESAPRPKWLIALTGGFPFLETRPVEVEIGTTILPFTGVGEWARTAEDPDNGMAVYSLYGEAQLQNRTYDVRSTSLRGTEVLDTYSADGFDTAWDTMVRLCDFES
ncbi:MAG: TIR domain-containing protein [Pseudomonadota bacterium]